MKRNTRRVRHLVALVAAYAVALQVLLSGVMVVSATAEASLHVFCTDTTNNTGTPPPHSGCCPGCFTCGAAGCGFAAAPARDAVVLEAPVFSNGTPIALASDGPPAHRELIGHPQARAPPPV